MDYPFENLGPNRFQQFCQSVLAREFPDLQCFPLGQSDAGRDATSLQNRLLYQVKFTANALSQRNSHKWLVGVVRDEIPKIQKLMSSSSVKRYVVLTNVKGTGAPDSGSIDLVNNELTKLVGIDAQVAR